MTIKLTRISFAVHDSQVGTVMRALKDFKVQHLDAVPITEKKSPVSTPAKGNFNREALLDYLRTGARTSAEISAHFGTFGHSVGANLRILAKDKKIKRSGPEKNCKWIVR